MKIQFVANSMIGESALPDFAVAPDDPAEWVRIRALDQLDCALDSDVVGRSQQETNTFSQGDEGGRT